MSGVTYYYYYVTRALDDRSYESQFQRSFGSHSVEPAAGEERLLEESKLPLGGSSLGLPTHVKVELQGTESYVTY